MDNLKDEVTLKPCPFCGCRVVCFKTNDKIHPYRVHCESCGNQTANHGSHGNAVKAWNARPADDVLEALHKALQNIEKRCAEYEHINLVGRTPNAKKGGTLRNVLLIARAALAKASQ